LSWPYRIIYDMVRPAQGRGLKPKGVLPL
jgi:hypothetical protein